MAIKCGRFDKKKNKICGGELGNPYNETDRSITYICRQCNQTMIILKQKFLGNIRKGKF